VPQEDVEVTEITVLEDRRLSAHSFMQASRHLQESGSNLKISAKFKVKAAKEEPEEDGVASTTTSPSPSAPASSASSEDLAKRVSALADAQSAENDRFSSVLGPSISEAASEIQLSNSTAASALTQVTTALQTVKPVVLSVAPPQVIKETTTTRSYDDVPDLNLDEVPDSAMRAQLCLVALLGCCLGLRAL